MPGFFQNGDPIKMRFFKIFCFIFGKKIKIRKNHSFLERPRDRKSDKNSRSYIEICGKLATLRGSGNATKHISM